MSSSDVFAIAIKKHVSEEREKIFEIMLWLLPPHSMINTDARQLSNIIHFLIMLVPVVYKHEQYNFKKKPYSYQTQTIEMLMKYFPCKESNKREKQFIIKYMLIPWTKTLLILTNVIIEYVNQEEQNKQFECISKRGSYFLKMNDTFTDVCFTRERCYLLVRMSTVIEKYIIHH